MRRTETVLTIAAVTGGALGALGCGSSSDPPATTSAAGTLTAPTVNAGTTTAEREATPRATHANRVDQAVRAVRTAQKRVKHGRAYDLESDRYRGKRVWEIDVASGRQRPYELHVSASGKTVVHRHRKRKVDDDVAKVRRAKVSMAKALRTAAKHADGGRLSEAEIDRDRGKVVWTVTFEQSGDAEVEVILDAKSGRVLRTVRDDD